MGIWSFYLNNYFIILCVFHLIIFLSSVLTKGWRFIGTRRLFWCAGVKFLWNVDFTVCFNDLPLRENKPGKSNAICFLIKHWFWSTFETCLVWVSKSPSWGKRSRPITGLWPSLTTVTLTLTGAQSLHFTDVWIKPIVLIKWRKWLDCDFPETVPKSFLVYSKPLRLLDSY